MQAEVWQLGSNDFQDMALTGVFAFRVTRVFGEFNHVHFWRGRFRHLSLSTYNNNIVPSYRCNFAVIAQYEYPFCISGLTYLEEPKVERPF